MADDAAMTRLELRRTAESLRETYGHLLQSEPSFYRPDADEAQDRLQEARERLSGREPDRQLTLDVR